MTLTIDDVIALRANCDDYVNAFKALEQSKLDFQRAEDNLMSNLPAVGFRVTVRTIVIDSHTFSGGDTRATCREALKYLLNQLLSNEIDPTKGQSTELLVRLYNIAKRYGVGYFSSNTMPIDGNGANPLRAVYYAARLLELPKPILYWYNATDD